MNGHVDLRRQLPSALLSFLGAVLGALLATVLPADKSFASHFPRCWSRSRSISRSKPRLDDVDRTERHDAVPVRPHRGARHRLL